MIKIRELRAVYIDDFLWWTMGNLDFVPGSMWHDDLDRNG